MEGNLFDFLSPWLKGRLKFRDHELKGMPGVHDPAAAAQALNAIIANRIDREAQAHGATVNNPLVNQDQPQ